QVDTAILKKISALANRVEKAFNEFRPEIDGKKSTDNEVRKILKSSTDSERRKLACEASKLVGPALEPDLKELVKLRNEAARALGFKNYHALQLFLNEQDGDELLKLFDELDRLTRDPFLAAKREIDEVLAKRCGVKVGDL